MKICAKCGVKKQREGFGTATYHTKTGKRERLKSYCKECFCDIERERKYGITPQMYTDMLNHQGGCCGICGKTNPGRDDSRFAVDHCHRTGKVRGLLCNNCNRCIGLLQDTPTILLAAATYLEVHG